MTRAGFFISVILYTIHIVKAISFDYYDDTKIIKKDDLNNGRYGFGRNSVDIEKENSEIVMGNNCYIDILDNYTAPDNWDWRDHNAVAPVKDQKNCKSWLFSTIAAVESQYAIQHKKLVSLSEQQLINCFDNGGDNSFIGSFAHIGIIDFANNGGCRLEEDYPLTASVGKCLYKEPNMITNIQYGCPLAKNVTEVQVKNTVHKYGPVIAGLCASKKELRKFKGDEILIPNKDVCPDNVPVTQLVLIVGYGTENGQDYWIIKNSWGTDWGSKGYMRLARGINACNILAYLARALVY